MQGFVYCTGWRHEARLGRLGNSGPSLSRPVYSNQGRSCETLPCFVRTDNYSPPRSRWFFDLGTSWKLEGLRVHCRAVLMSIGRHIPVLQRTQPLAHSRFQCQSTEYVVRWIANGVQMARNVGHLVTRVMRS